MKTIKLTCTCGATAEFSEGKDSFVGEYYWTTAAAREWVAEHRGCRPMVPVQTVPQWPVSLPMDDKPVPASCPNCGKSYGQCLCISGPYKSTTQENP